MGHGMTEKKETTATRRSSSVCQVCGENVTLTPNGFVPSHYPVDVKDAYFAVPGFFCHGSDKRQKATKEPS